MTPPESAFVQGTLDLLILKTLTWGPRHGYAIARWIEDTTDDALAVQEGSLYPALYRMRRRGWVKVEWGESEHGRSVHLYALTPAGRARLKSLTAHWRRCVATMARVLGA